MAKQTGLDLTGDKALVAAMKEFPQKFQNKAMRKILRETMKTVVKRDYDGKVAKGRTKQLKKNKLRSIPRSRNKIGSRLSVEAALHASFVLLGTKFQKAQRTLRIALFENAARIKIQILNSARAALPKIAAEVKAKTKPKG